MSVDTKGRLNKKYGVKKIQRALKHKFNIDAIVTDTYSRDYYILSFEHNGDKRNLSVFENYKDDFDGIIGTRMSIGMWGSAVELMRGIIEVYGGEIIENDCSDDDWTYISPSSKIHLTEEETLEDKLLSKLSQEDISYSNKKLIIDYIKNNMEFIKSL